MMDWPKPVLNVPTKPAEYAKALRRVLTKYTIEEVAEKIGKPVSWIEEKLRPKV